MIKPFEIIIRDEMTDDLKRRIQETRWPHAAAPVNWEDGTSLVFIQSLLGYWASGFDWRTMETRMNAHPNFMAEMDGHSIHFQHIRGRGEKMIPLLITHGWPGSFLEMAKIIPLLTGEGSFLLISLFLLFRDLDFHKVYSL